MKFDLGKSWRLSEINVKYEVSPTYPKFHIVPVSVADDDLTRIAEFRSSRRFPSIVWRCVNWGLFTRLGGLLFRLVCPPGTGEMAVSLPEAANLSLDFSAGDVLKMRVSSRLSPLPVSRNGQPPGPRAATDMSRTATYPFTVL
jgi:hypothetical protein